MSYLPSFLEALEQGHVFNAKELWQQAIHLGRQARSADWDRQELHYLQTAAVMGHQRLVKVLITRLSGNDLLAPLECALDCLLTNSNEKAEGLPAPLRQQVEGLIQLIQSPALCSFKATA